MDKKDLYAIIEGIVTEISEANGLSESVARAFVGTALQQNRQAFINAVVVPKLQVAEPAEAAS